MQQMARGLILCFILISVGCASLGLRMEQPQVKVVSLRMLASDNIEQHFAIGLSITNPNSFALNLIGMSYSLRLQGYDLLSGVARDIPPIAAYSEVPLEMTASVNLISSLRFIQDLMRNRHEMLEYELVARLDTGSLLPAIRVVESGAISLNTEQ